MTYTHGFFGRRTEIGTVKKHLATGMRIRFHAIRKYNRLYWTADRAVQGLHEFYSTKTEAMTLARILDVVTDD